LKGDVIMHIVVVGFGTAGWLATVNLRKWNRKDEISVIDEKSYDIYHPCSQPYVIGGELSDTQEIVEPFNNKMLKVNFYRRHRATKIDRRSKTIFVEDLQTGQNLELQYDYLILATGSQPWSPPIPGVNSRNVYSLKWIEDTAAIRNAASSAKKAVVIGASAIGLEVGIELAKRGIDTVIIELLPHILPKALDQDFAEYLQEKLLQALPNLRIFTGTVAKEFHVNDSGLVERVITDKEEFDTDIVIMATGVRPNVSLAKEAGLKIGKYGGIVVDETMRTSDPSIYAAGDCVETLGFIDKKPTLALLASSAVRMARIAAMSIVKPGFLTFPGVLNNFIVPLVNIRVGSVGLTTHTATENGYSFVTAKVKTTDKPEHIPDATEFLIKLLIEKNTGKFLGAQAIGSDSITDNLNIISLAIQSGLTYKDILNSDLCYAPAVNDTLYPVVKAIELALKKLSK